MKKFLILLLMLNSLFLGLNAESSTQNTVKQGKKTQNKIGIFPTTIVKKMQVKDSKRYYGKLQENEGSVYSLSLRVDGFIQKLFVQNTYTKVQKDSKLFTLFSTELLDAQSELLAASGSHFKGLAREKLELLGVDKKEIAKIQSGHRILNEITYYAPISGYIFTKNVNIGSGVKKGEEVFKIVNLDSLWVIADINEEDLSFLQNAQNKAYVEVEGVKGRSEIALELIYPNVVDNFLKVRFILQNKFLDGDKVQFFPNSFAYIFIESAPRTALTLPKTALLFKNNKYFVFIKDDEEFLPQIVEVKRILGSDLYEVIEGLDEGDEVVKNALFVLDSDAQNNGDFE